jgi:hypothetical protein
MSKRKFLIFLSMILATVVFAWTSGDAVAQEKGTKGVANKEVVKGVVKGQVTRDDQAKYLGKKTPTEQKAAAKRARQLGIYPGVAGFATQAPAPGGTR